MDYIKKHDVVFILSFCFLNILIRLPFVSSPAFWDEVNYLYGARTISENKLNPFVEFWGYKPPVVFEPVSLLFSLFSPSVIWARLYIFFFSSLALLFCYLLGRKLFSKEVGLISTLFLSVFPLFCAQSLLYLDAVPLTTLCLATLYFYFSEKKMSYVISATLLCLTKEPAVFIPIIILLYDTFTTMILHKEERGLILKKFPAFFLPILIFFLWATTNLVVFGWFVWPYNVHLFLAGGFLNYFNMEYVRPSLLRVFFSQAQWLSFILIVVGIGMSLKKNSLRKREGVLFGVIFVFYFLFYYFTSLLHRYMLFVYPLVFIYLAYLITNVFKRIRLFLILTICFFFISHSLLPHIEPPGYDRDDDLCFIKEIISQQMLVKYVEKQFPDNYKIVADWPFSFYYSDPFLGYVKRARKVTTVDCENGKYERSYVGGDWIYINSNKNCVTVENFNNMSLIKRYYFVDFSSAKIYHINK